MGMSLPVFGLATAIILIAVYLGKLPKGLTGAIPLMMVMGAILNEIGNRTPIIKDYFGGGPIVIIFGSAALFTYGIIPEYAKEIAVTFTKAGGFLNFYIAALITGSILGMNRKLLIKASMRYLPAILGGVIVALGLVGIVGALIGYGFKEAVRYIGVPIMGGGMGAGAVPLSEMFGEFFNADVGKMLSVMIPALAMGNALAIVAAGVLDKIGKKNTSLTGNGKLMRIESDDFVTEEVDHKVSFELMGMGMLIATTFYILGSILNKFIPIHSYALMIISVAIVKAMGLMPRKYEVGAFQFFRFIMITLIHRLFLWEIGVAYTDLAAVISAFTIQYVILVAVTIAGAIIGSGLVGHFMRILPHRIGNNRRALHGQHGRYGRCCSTVSISQDGAYAFRPDFIKTGRSIHNNSCIIIA